MVLVKQIFMHLVFLLELCISEAAEGLLFRAFDTGGRAIASNFSIGLQSASMLWGIVNCTILMRLPASTVKFRCDCPAYRTFVRSITIHFWCKIEIISSQSIRNKI